MIDETIINSLQPISLEEMGKVKLMNRIDIKYVSTVANIEELLKRVYSGYFIQQIDNYRNMPYYTRYYDTPDVDMFYQHQRGKKTRQKIRTRLYEGTTNLPFLEIKSKNNNGRTRKKRVMMEVGNDLTFYRNFLQANTEYDFCMLSPQIENHFYRVTLVNKAMTERITIDTGIEFHNIVTDNKISLDNLGIIEWKRDGQSPPSSLEKILREIGIHESGFSKYCIGMAITNPMLQQNRIKKRLRNINKISPFMW